MSDTVRFVLVGVIVILSGALAVNTWWQWRKARQARLWPTTEATIESSAMEVVNHSKYGDIRLPVFAFSYQIRGEFYGGRFALLPYITDPGEGILERLIGRKLQLRYNSQHPEEWFVSEELIEGCKVEQKLGLHLSQYYPND